MTGLAASAARLDAAARALADVVDALPPPDPDRWAGAAAEAAADAAAALRGRGMLLAGRARALADTVRAVATSLPAVPAPDDPRLVPADDRVAAALGAVLVGPGARGPAAVGPDPVTVAAWWAGLTAEQRERLVRERPDLVGGLDGLPATDRDRANRVRLGAAEAAARADLQAQGPIAAVLGDLGDLGGLVGLDLPWDRVRTRLDRLVALRAALAGPDHRLVVFDEDGADGGRVRAAVASGDIDTAARVGVFTPGFTADVRDLGPRLGELEGVRAAAGPGTAVVAWYGYDAPRWRGVADPDASVLGGAAARAGGGRLAPFLDGLDAVRPGAPPRVTAIGHSYGSVTTAQAVAQGADGVDDVVHLGSPGVPGAAGPEGPPGHVWVAEAAGDPVADAGWFGVDPNRAPGVVGLSTREVVLPDGRVLSGVRGHVAYLQPGSTSAHDVAAVVAGRPDVVVLDRGIGVGDRLRRLLEPSR